MSQPNYAIVSSTDFEWHAEREDDGAVSLTSALGCEETEVDAVRLAGGDAHPLPTATENVCLPIDGPGELVAGDSLTVPDHGVARVPAGVDGELGGDDPTTWVVVSAPAEATPGAEPVVIDLDRLDYAPVASGILTVRLTDRLGCEGMKANPRLLKPGDRVPYHTEGTQEELFVPLSGPATMLIAGERYELASGSVARVAPEVPRSAMNDGDEEALWFMVGAPPTGGAREWDPGAEVVDWPDTG